MKEYLLISLLIGGCSFVYTNLLMEPDQLFGKLYKKAYNMFECDKAMIEGRSYHPLFKILFHCEKCNAGQIALWYYLFSNLKNYFTINTALIGITFILFSILTAAVVRGIYNRYIG